MTFPRTVKIAGVSVRVVFKDYPDKSLFGEWDLDKKTIYLRKGLDEETAADTLYHEMWHAAMDLSGLSFLDGFLDEPLARAWDLFRPTYDATRERIQNLS